jgi:hypothetical protein
VRCFRENRRRHPGVQSLLPPADAKTPTVTGGEAGKPELRMGRDQVVSLRAGKLQKLRRHDRANCMQSNIAGTGTAKAISIEPSGRLAAAAL